MNYDTSSTKQLGLIKGLIGSGVVLATLALYVSTLAPTVLEADAGEFQFVLWLPGIAHPTGYPLYILVGWLWSHLLPIGQVAWRINLLSAVFAAGAVGLTYLLAQKIVGLTLPNTPILAQLLAATLTALTFAVTPTFWSQAIIAEVYALHALFVTIILWLTLKYRSQQSSLKWGILLAFTCGLGLTHHITTSLLFPALVLYLWVTQNKSNIFSRQQLKRGVLYSLIFIVPLLLYLYLPLIAPSTPYATIHLSTTQTLTLYDNSWQGFLQHITATVFTDELKPTAIGSERFGLTGRLLLDQVGWVGVALGIMGLFTLWRQKRIDLLLLTGLTFLAVIGFNLIYFIGDVFVLFIPAWLMVCLWIGVGMLGLSHRLAHRFVQSKMSIQENVAFKQMQEQLGQNIYQLVIMLLLLFFFVLPMFLLATNRQRVNQRYNTAASQRWLEILQEPLPSDAILLSNDRNEIMPMWYYQFVEEHRPDLGGLFPLIVPQPAYANVGQVLEQALISKRPVYLIKEMNGLNIKAKLEPAGTLFKATAYPTPLVNSISRSLPEITVMSSTGQPVSETITVSGYDVFPPTPQPNTEFTITLQWQPTQLLSTNYTSYVHLTTPDGQRIAQSDHQPGGDFYPSSYWQPGEILYDHHTLALPTDVPDGSYLLRVGMYYQPEPGLIQGMGDGIEIGQLTVRQ